MSSLLFLPFLVPVVACGGGGGSKDHPDANVIGADATPDAPPPPPGCDFAELRDDSNDDAVATGSPEDPGMSFSGAMTLCGSINKANFDADSQSIDADGYLLTLANDGAVLVSLSGTGLEALDFVQVAVYNGQGFTSQSAYGIFATNHGALTVPLEAGTYEIYVSAFSSAAPAADIPYKVKVAADDNVDTRCAPVTTGGYAEAHDNGDNLGNNMIDIDFGAMTLEDFEKFTSSSSDAAEDTQLTANDGTPVRFTGTAASTNTPVGSYLDHDTFEFTTGANTNEITVRAAFTGADADLDLFVFEAAEAGDTSPIELTESAFGGTGPNEEIVTLAVKPSTKYWVLVGNYYDPDATSGPGAYSTTICGKNYTPPTN